MAITTIDQWLDAVHELKLPSGKTAGVRDVDILAIMTEDGEVPSVLQAVTSQHIAETEGVAASKNSNPEIGMNEMAELTSILDRVIDACWVSPAIVSNKEDVQARKGITKDMISFADKMAVWEWSMGGMALIGKAKNFPQGQAQGLELVQARPNSAMQAE